MERSHPVAHGRHRQKPGRGGIVLAVLVLAVLVGALVVAALSREAVDTNPSAGGGSEPAPRSAGDRPGEGDQEVPATPQATPTPVVSQAPPAVGGAVPDRQPSPLVAVTPTGASPVPPGPPPAVTSAPEASQAHLPASGAAVAGYDSDLMADHVVVLDTRTDGVAGAVPAGGEPSAAVTSDAPPGHDSRTGSVTSSSSDVVAAVDLRTDEVATTIPVGEDPGSPERSPDGTRVAVVDHPGDVGTVIGTATDQVSGTVPDVGAPPQDRDPAPDGRHRHTADLQDGTASVVDVAAGAVTAWIPTADGPTGVPVLPDGRQGLVGHVRNGTVPLLDTAAAGQPEGGRRSVGAREQPPPCGIPGGRRVLVGRPPRCRGARPRGGPASS